MNKKELVNKILWLGYANAEEGKDARGKAVIDGEKAVNEYLESINFTSSCEKLKDRKIKDLLNWVKSDLRQEENHKLGKTDTPYRAEKLRFLRKLIELESL